MLDLLRKLESAANRAMNRTRRWIDVGAFRAYFDETSDLIWLNYATPYQSLGNEAETRSDIAALRKEFAARRRKLRFEFIEPLWPGVAAMLRAGGLRLQAAQPLMVCSPASLRSRTPAELRTLSELRITTLSAAHSDASLDAFIRVSAEVFGRGSLPHELAEQRARLRIELQAGARRAVMGWIGDRPAGVAALTPAESIGELVGVATLPEFRRRGIASALCSKLVSDHFQAGGDIAWLSAEDAAAQAMYRTIGFNDAGIYANYILP